ncbi:MAG TPA: VWA domain-containing protein [Thermoanaerobaculia bacterium]|nr:VWA domain-containing protein [Thermoanaerobaculia bacterium]
MSRPRALSAAVLAAAVLFAAPGARAAETPPAAPEPSAPEGLFIDRVEVNVVNLEVFVVDRDGRRVTDLGRDDFELRVDGRPVEIANFYASRGAAAGEEAEAAFLPGAAVAGAAGAPAVAPSDPDELRERRLNLMVYVDHTFLRPGNRRRVLDHLREFLATGLDEHTWVMLVGYDGAVHVDAPLTRDRETLRAGLDALGGHAGGPGPLTIDRVIHVLQNTPTDAATGERLGLDQILTSFMAQEEAKLRLSVHALAESLALFAGLPGRKAVLHVSDGLPAEVMQAAQAMFATDSSPVAGLRQGERRLYDELVRHAQAHQIALYPMDARGSGSEPLAGADVAMRFDPAGPVITTAELTAMETLNRQEPLIEMAAATGGTAVLDTFDFDRALDAISADFESFYSLGFAAPDNGDGHRHAIDVRVTRPGLRVRHREAYVDKPLVERVRDRTTSFLHLGMESNPMGVELALGEPERDGRRWIVPLLVRVPAAGVTLLPDAEARRGRLHFFLVVRDDRGRVSKLTHLPHPLTVPLDQAAPDESDLGLGIHLEVRPGSWTVAVGVWDEIGGGESYVRERVEIVEPEPPPRRGRHSR